MGSARAPVAVSGSWPAWIWRGSKDQSLDIGYSLNSGVHRTGSRLSGLPEGATRACLPPCGGRPGLHPGHPTAVGGLPASKPGLHAGTHDLTTGSPMAAASGKLGTAYVTACESAGPLNPGRRGLSWRLGL